MALCCAAVPAPALGTPQRATLSVAPAAAPPPLRGAITSEWKAGAQAQLGWDLPNGRAARETTDVYVLVDKHNLYVAFDATQTGPLSTTQRTNNIGEGSDDDVHVVIWPSGPSGFRYEFLATPLGTRYQHSTENDAYAPVWTAIATTRPGGYTVTMAIPLEVVRSSGNATWFIQLYRNDRQSGEQYIWSHENGQTDPLDVTRAGKIEGMAIVAHPLPKPRFGAYILGQAGSASAGGNAVRIGADGAIPFTPTASAIFTIHPDYSNVEVDQQTIAPTAFTRTYTEVRPFFTQGSSFYNNYNCYGCPGIIPLYTYDIPTPRSGYAIEGVQGPLHFAAFDAVGDGRTDAATGISLQTDDKKWSLGETSTWSNIDATATSAAVHDAAMTASLGYSDQKHWQGYVNYGYDRGTNVLDNAQGQYEDAGVAWFTKDDFDAFTIRKVGAYFSPVIGYIQLADLAGYSAQINHTFRYAATSPLKEVDASLFMDSYQSTSAGTNLFDANANLYVALKNRFSADVEVGSDAAYLPGDTLRPYTQDGITLYYDKGRPAQDTFGYTFGSYAAGYLQSWTRVGAVPLTKRATLILEADDTNWNSGDINLKQWLERVGFTWALSKDATLGLGARKIIGAPPPSGATPLDPASTSVNQTNLSFNLAIHRPHDELYIAYGDPNQVTTFPAFIIKLIHYFGAQKGT